MNKFVIEDVNVHVKHYFLILYWVRQKFILQTLVVYQMGIFLKRARTFYALLKALAPWISERVSSATSQISKKW